MAEQTREEIVRQRNSDFLYTFTGVRNERVLAYLSLFCLEKDCTFVTGDVHKSSYNQGVRRVMLEIRHWLDMDITKLEQNEKVEDEENE